MQTTDTTEAILARLRELDTTEPISLYEFAPLIKAGFDQHVVANTLFAMERDKIIELMPDNRLMVLRAI